MNLKIVSWTFLLAASLGGAAVAGETAETVSLASLLQEMLDPAELAKLPVHDYRLRMHSSYDRHSQPGTEGTDAWYANDDWSYFERVEQNGDLTECVLLDAKGPGAVVRFWSTVGLWNVKDVEDPKPCNLRIYVDGELLAKGPLFQLLSGGQLCGAPLSTSLAPETIMAHRGHNLYLPIPFAKSCKITYDSKAASERRENFYYAVETREYVPGTPVESLTPAVLARDAGLVEAANRQLLQSPEGPQGRKGEFKTTIPPGESQALELQGPGAVKHFAFRLNTGTGGEPSKHLWLEFTFDGQKTVEVPVAYFFASAGNLAVFNTRFIGFDAQGRYVCNWWMPYRQNCELRLVNKGKDAVKLFDGEYEVVEGPAAWDSRSLHFGVSFQPLYNTPTRKDGKCFEVNYAQLQGTGKIVGAGVFVRNTDDGWWGEGDEKVYVDGESFPSIFGTGSEDHYGYAWCNFHTFAHPFLAQPDGAGANWKGTASNVRWRVLDAVRFTRSCSYNLELWHWRNDLTIDYVPICYWYGK